MNNSTQTLKSRDDVARLIRAQLDHEGRTLEKGDISGTFHYGLMELRELLDFIYGKPKDGDFLLLSGVKHTNGYIHKGFDGLPSVTDIKPTDIMPDVTKIEFVVDSLDGDK